MLNKKKIVILMSVVILLILITSLSSAQTSTSQKFYCCCSKTPGEAPYGGATTTPLCPSGFEVKQFDTATQALTPCTTLCGVPVQTGTPTIGCSDPNYNPAPQITIVKPITGENKLKLTLSAVCPESIKEVILKRCKRSEQNIACTDSDFNDVGRFPFTTEYTDSNNVEFGAYYDYVLKAEYKNGKSVDSSKKQGYAGDIECLNRNNAIPFCVFESTYREPDTMSYLSQYGYGLFNKDAVKKTSQETTNAYDLRIQRLLSNSFGEYYRAAFTCNAENKKTKIVGPCASDKMCKITSSTTAACIKQDECETGSNPFGLFYGQTLCEQKNGCYYDKSSTIIDKCYSCPLTAQMQCYDYKSEGACNAKKCGPHTCEWKSTFPNIGTGVCVDTSKDNCDACDNPGSTPDSSKIYNSIFDKCTKDKADKLEVAGRRCFFSSNKAISCDKVTCKDYKDPTECNSPLNGIQLGNNNEKISTSSDYCGIGVCEWASGSGSGECFKNSDGQRKDPKRDCGLNDAACEKDFFPPETTLTTTRSKGATDRIVLVVKDKTEKNSDPEIKSNYEVYLCLNNSAQGCQDAQAFGIKTKVSELIVGNGIIREDKIKDGKDLFIGLSEGKYTLRYFTKDPYNNLEVVKDKVIEICSDCHGPDGSFDVTNSQKHVGKFYVNQGRPEIAISFLQPAKIISAKISDSKQDWSYVFPADSFSTTFAINLPSGVSLPEGEYTFTFNAISSNGLLMDAQKTFKLIVDMKTPGFAIASKVTADDAKIDFTLTKTGNVTSAILYKEIPLTEYAVLSEQENIKNVLKPTEFASKFSADILNLKDGKYTINANAEDIAGNSVANTSTFFVSKEENKIYLVAPKFGASKKDLKFNIELHTTKKSDCGYTSNLEQGITFDDLYSFFATQNQQADYTHTITNFDGITKFDEPYLLRVFCKAEGKVTEKQIYLIADNTNPEILSAEALQSTLIDYEFSDGVNKYYTTNLTATLNEPGFCQYITKKDGAEINRGNFFEYDLVPKQYLTTKINVTAIGDYTFEIYCKNAAGLWALDKKIVNIKVDTTAPLEITSTTPSTFKDPTGITLSVKTNKRATCTYKASPTGNSFPFARGLAMEHSKIITLQSEAKGILTYYVTCTAEKEKAEKTISLIRDPTPPTQPKVEIISDTSDPLVQWKTDKMQVKFNATDPETGIKGFWYKVESKDGKTIVSDWAFRVNDSADGAAFNIMTDNSGNKLQLLNSQSYIVKVKAVNNLDVNSTPEVSSKEVKIDIQKQPQPCQNHQQDPGELGIDCGGLCEPCPEETFCTKDLDCASGSCVLGKCKMPSCSNGNFDKDTETDKDCGNKCAKKCDVGQKCVTPSDCVSKSCKVGKCTAPKPCVATDKIANCGGDCDDKCGVGEICSIDKDCESNLACSKAGKCEKALDTDKDGVPDKYDQCPDTPLGSKDVYKTGPNQGCTEEQLKKPITPTPTPTKSPSPTVSPTKSPTKTPIQPGPTEGSPWLKYGLVLLILAALGYGGFYAYTIFAKKPEEKPDEFPGLGPLPKQIEMPKFEHGEKPFVKTPITPFGRPMHPIRKPIIHPKIKPKIAIPKKEEFIPLEVLKERVKGKEKVDVFEKLKKYQPKKEPKLERETKSDVFEKLKKYKKSK